MDSGFSFLQTIAKYPVTNLQTKSFSETELFYRWQEFQALVQCKKKTKHIYLLKLNCPILFLYVFTIQFDCRQTVRMLFYLLFPFFN